MKALLIFPVCAVAAVSSLSAIGNPLKGERKTNLKRVLPPAVELDARSFTITANAQKEDAKAVAESFREMFRAKIQNDSRFVMSDTSPALRISINVARFYTEPKQIAAVNKGDTPCATYIGNLQGTFTIVELASGHPLASDTVSWKLEVGSTREWLVSEDGRQMRIPGPHEKLGIRSAWGEVVSDTPTKGGTRFPPVPPRPGGKARPPSPCDRPLTLNEATDVLSDAFLTDLIHLAVPYEEIVEVPLAGGKFKKIADDMAGGRWENAGEDLTKMGEDPKPDEEAERQYMLGLTAEAAGYNTGKQIFDLHQQVKPGAASDELVKVQKQIRDLVDQAKEEFAKATFAFKKAGELKSSDQDYHTAERRAELSEMLYVRIEKYRDLAGHGDTPPAPAGLTMNDIVNSCTQGLDEEIIVDRIEHAPALAAKREELDDLVKCGAKQKPIYAALKKRWVSEKK